MQNSQHNTSPTPSNQPSLFDALAAADEAIQRVDRNADEGWKMAATQAVWDRSRMSVPFTTDDIMDDLDNMGVVTHDNRALGPVIRRMINKNVITEISMTRSRRRHGARIPVYAGTRTVTTTQERGE